MTNTASDRREHLRITDTCQIVLRLGAGFVELHEGAAGAITVDISGPEAARFQITQHGDRITIQPEAALSGLLRRHDVRIRVPAGAASLQAQVASADFRADVDMRGLDLTAASGNVTLRRVAGDVQIRLASGDLDAERIGGDLGVVSASGDVQVDTVGGAATVTTASGSVRIGHVAGPLSVKTASGDLDVERFAGVELDCKTLSGDVRVGLEAGRHADVDLESFTGSIRNAFDVQTQTAGASAANVHVRVRTMSGDIVLRRSREVA
jgi:hypothetical protein